MYFRIFLFFFSTRVIFSFVSVLFGHGFSFVDEYHILSDRVLEGNFDFDVGRFIVSPFYPIFIALHKFLLPGAWYYKMGFTLSQWIISSISGVYFFRLGKLLFSKNSSLISTIILGIFPMTLWWTHTYQAESIFQSFLIISLYFLVKSVKFKQWFDVMISAGIYSLAFLTKSHILLFSPFVVFYYFLNIKGKKRFLFPLSYAIICLLLASPFGLYNFVKHGTFVISSNGAGFHFYTGNSNFGYRTVVNVPPQSSVEFRSLSHLKMSKFNGEVHDRIFRLSQKEKQTVFFYEAIRWIRGHPLKFIKLKLYDLTFYLIPGVSFRHYPFGLWILSFIFSFPIYVFGYMGLYKALRTNYRSHFYALGIFIAMLVFSVLFYVQNRFRTITIEPIYILYAGFIIVDYYEFLKEKSLERINSLFQSRG